MQAVQTYTLPPDKYIQAIEYAHARHILHFAGFAIALLAVIVILRFKIAPRWRRLHPALFIAAITLLTAFCDLPAGVCGHWLSLHYGISVQAWPSWLWDWMKEQAVGVVIAIAVFAPFYWLLRRSPKRWWWYAWLASIPVMIISAIADPLIIEPLFNRFEPLTTTHPELVEPIERMLQRAGVAIPRERLYEMKASEKTHSLNAYVSGFGPTRRVVLYDTIIEKEKGPPLATTFGHELGHYALGHISQGLALGAMGLLAALWLASRAIDMFVRRWGAALDIPAVSDYASLPAFLLFALVLSFVSEPIDNAISRRFEHQADIYSLEITHGLVPNAAEAAARAFQIEGETDLDEPNPGPFIRFWLYSHPPTAERLRFALEYDAWSPGRHPRYVK
jgi:STE24 endopeptidase